MVGLTDAQARRMKHITRVTERSSKDIMNSGFDSYLDFQDLKHHNKGKHLRLVAVDEDGNVVKVISEK